MSEASTGERRVRRPGMRSRIGVAVAMTTMLVLAVGAPGAVDAAPAPAEIDVTYDCADGVWLITSTKAISNIVHSDGQTHTRIVFDGDPEVSEYRLDAVDVETIWVKSGSNHSPDGRGYGERFDVEIDCGPVDADGDGYPDDVDCDDTDPAISPDATDIPNDGIDQNCDGVDLVVGSGDVRVTLIWDGDDDLDVHVIDPAGERIWYMDPASASGGVLDRDDNINVCGIDPEPGGVENIFWPTGSAPAGTYTVEVYSFNDCAPADADWTLQVFVGGVLVVDQSGTGGGGDALSQSGVEIHTTTFTHP